MRIRRQGLYDISFWRFANGDRKEAASAGGACLN